MIFLATAFALYQKECEFRCSLWFVFVGLFLFLHLPFLIRIYHNNNTVLWSSKNVSLFLSEILHLVCEFVFNLLNGLRTYR